MRFPENQAPYHDGQYVIARVGTSSQFIVEVSSFKGVKPEIRCIPAIQPKFIPGLASARKARHFKM